MSYPIKLAMVDFDWTLFRSPLPPGGLEKTWWDSLDSLTPPVVPSRPKKEWWIEKTVEQVRRIQKASNTLVAVITGRNKRFQRRIEELVKQCKLYPQYILTHDPKIRGEKQILRFKVNAVKDILEAHPTISELVVWEDLQSQLEEFQKLTKKRGMTYTPHHVGELTEKLWTP